MTGGVVANFDPAGSAATAQANAETYAAGQAAGAIEIAENNTSAGYLPKGGGNLSGSLNLTGNPLNLNTGAGTGGGNLSLDGGNLNNGGTIEFNHLSSGPAGSMSCALQSGADGGGGSASVNGNDACGTVTLSLGSGTQTAGALLEVTFNAAYSIAPTIILIPVNANAASDISEFIATATTTGFTISTTSSISHPANSYQFAYIVM